ncbi:MAG: efflux RND transporter periplasmic adaptor subunit [Phycisphaerales bacterium]
MPASTEESKSPASAAARDDRPASARIRTFAASVVGSAVVIGAFLIAAEAWRFNQRHPNSDTAGVNADTVGIAPQVGGPIVALHVRQGDRVEAGQLLFEIDPTRFDLALREAEAALTALDAQIRLEALREVQLRLVAEAAEADVAAAIAQAANRRVTVERLEPVTARGFSTEELLDEARTALATAEAMVVAAKARAAAAAAAQSEVEELRAQRAGFEVAIELARLERSHCDVRAPVAGTVISLDLAEGAFAMPGLEVFQLVAADTWFVDALFLEGELRWIRPGDRAEIVVMTAPDRRWRGIVESIGVAVRPSDELVFQGIPVIRRKLDWVRVAQRFPVRLRIEDGDPELFRMGASATVAIAPTNAGGDA